MPSSTKDSALSQTSSQSCTVSKNDSIKISPDLRPTKVHSPKPPPPRATPWTSPWYACRLRDQKPFQAIALLRTLTHSQRHLEATEEVLQELNRLSLEDATNAIQELRGPKRFIHGTTGNSLTLRAELTTLDDQCQFSLHALVDSGCTGSLIDAGFVEAKGLNTHPLP